MPIVVAMNKIDRPDANPDKVLGELATQSLNPAEWGGDTEVVRTSAMTGQGIDDLLEILDLQAELMELRAAPATPARGRVIEARQAQGLGPVATVLVQHGTLKVGDVIPRRRRLGPGPRPAEGRRHPRSRRPRPRRRSWSRASTRSPARATPFS